MTPDNECDHHLARAELLIEQGRFEQALDETGEAIRLGPQDAYAFALRSACLNQLGRLDEALESARTAIAREPQAANGFVALCMVQLSQQQVGAALESAENAVTLAPEDYLGWTLKAEALMFQARWADAYDAARRAYELNGDDPRVASQFAYALMRTGREAEANDLLKNSLRINPNAPDSRLVLGLRAMTEGRFQDAQEYYEEAIRLNPTADATREGMLLALKSRSMLFRVLFPSEQSAPTTLLVFLFVVAVTAWGFWHNARAMVFGGQFEWEPGSVIPILGVILAAVAGEFARSYADFFVYLSRLGRPLLSPPQVRSAFVSAACLLAAGACLLSLWLGAPWTPWLPCAGSLFFVSHVHSDASRSRGFRWVLNVTAGLLSVLACLVASWLETGGRAGLIWHSLLALQCGYVAGKGIYIAGRLLYRRRHRRR